MNQADRDAGIATRKLGQGDVRVGSIALGAMAFAG